MPLHQSHEQEDAEVLGVGGVIGLSVSYSIAAMVNLWPRDFYMPLSLRGRKLPMKLQQIMKVCCSKQDAIASKAPADVIIVFGNLFEDDCIELLDLNSWNCMKES